MIDKIRKGVKKLRTNLHLGRILRLVWSVAKGWTTLAFILIGLESLCGLTALLTLKKLINIVSDAGVRHPGGEQIVLKYVIFTASATCLFVVARVISALVTQIQAAKVSEYIDDHIHASAINLDLAFYESPAYFDILKRAKEAGPERPNAIVTALIEIIKNTLMFLIIGSILFSIDWFLLPLIALFVLPTLAVSIRFSDKLLAWRMRQTPLERKATYLSTLLTGDVSAKEIRAI